MQGKIMRFLNSCVLGALLLAAPVAAQAGPIGIGDFSGSETVSTYDGLGLPFTNSAPVVIDGNSYTTDDGFLRYSSTFDPDCTNECIGNNSDLGWIDVALGGPATRVGALVGGDRVSYTGFVEFFDVSDVLLGSVNFGGNTGLIFAGWEDAGGISRMRVTDTASNGLITHMEDLRFEGRAVNDPGPTPVPAPATLGLLIGGLAALGMRRRKKA